MNTSSPSRLRTRHVPVLASLLLLTGCGIPSFASPGEGSRPSLPPETTGVTSPTTAATSDPLAVDPAPTTPVLPTSTGPESERPDPRESERPDPGQDDVEPGGSRPVESTVGSLTPFERPTRVGEVEFVVHRPRAVDAAVRAMLGPGDSRSYVEVEFVNTSQRSLPVDRYLYGVLEGDRQVSLLGRPLVVTTDEDPALGVASGDRWTVGVGLPDSPKGDYRVVILRVDSPGATPQILAVVGDPGSEASARLSDPRARRHVEVDLREAAHPRSRTR